MKFKYLAILFNIILVFFLLSVILAPVILTGHSPHENLWRSTWPIALALALALAGLNAFFIANYQLFRLLEREDWPALAYCLEEKIYEKKQYSIRKVRLLANSYLILCDFPSIFKLESRAAICKPAAIAKNALIFGTARLLSGDFNGAAVFYKNILARGKVREEQWVRWFSGLSQILAGNPEQAEAELKSLAASCKNVIIAGLSAYFLAGSLGKYSLNPEECHSISEKSRARVKKAYKNITNWKKKTEKIGAEIHGAIIRKYVIEAGSWLFEE